jgi:hypothetical protein
MRSKFLSLVRTTFLTMLVMAFAAIAHAQFRTSIQGTVTDPTGAVIPNAKLTLKDNSTNQTTVHTSDSAGVFNFNALPADQFTLTATSPGFKSNVLSHLQLIPEQANSVNVKLELGDVAQSVTVDASANPAVDTETSNIGTTVTSNDIQHLPSFNRDVFTLTQLAPGAVSDGSQGSGGGVYNFPGNQGPGGSGNSGAFPTENGVQANANGGQYQTNGISIDGISTVSAVWGGTSIITPNEDSIDNVRVVTNDYDAENGRFSGAQTLVTSKSGTNQFHGSLYIALYRPGLNASNRVPKLADGTYVGSATKDTQRYNQYGGSIGGPILKDKLFAFFAYESSPDSTNSQGTGWYETSTFESAAPAGSIASKFLTFPGSAVSGTLVTSGETCKLIGLQEGVNCSTIPGQGLDIGSPLKIGLGKQDPTASGTSNNPGVGSGLDGVADIGFYKTSSPFSSYYHQYNGRLDGNLTQKDHLSFAIYWVPQGNTSYNGGARAYNLFHHQQINEALSTIYNHTFSPTFLNEARVNAAGWRWNEIGSNPQAPVGLPDDQVANIGSISINQFGSSLGSILNQWTYGAKDVATKVIHTHTLKFGGEYTKLEYLADPIGRPNYGFYDVWDFLNDAPYQESGGFNSVTGFPGGNRVDTRENLFGFFVQDDWKAMSNLTLHAGVRYSYFGSLFSKQNNLPVAQLGSGSAAFTGLNVRLGGNLWTPQKGNFGPQLGFNYSPQLFHGNLTVRGGYGLNFNQEEIAITANTIYNPPTQNYYNFQFNNPSTPGTNGGDIIYGISSNPNSLNGFASNPNTITAYNTANLPVAGNANVIIFGNGAGKLPTEYSEHFSLDTEYQFGRQLVASAGYEGSVGRHLINHQSPDAAAVAAGNALNPLVTSGDYWVNAGSSNNNALLLELKHPMVHHFTADAQFMLAKSMDTDGSGPYSEDPYFPEGPGYSYGRSDFNVGKSFKLFGLWEPIFFHGGNQYLEKLAGGWSLSGILNLHTGFPYTPNYGLPDSIYCSQCGYYNLRPSYLGGGGSDHSNKAFINGSDFANILTNQQQTNATINGTANTPVAYSNKFFSVPNYANAIQATNNTGFPAANVALPPAPGMDRNAFTGPGYRDVDATITKSFGLPNNRILGENAQFEIRANALNLYPQSVSNNINSSNFGQDTSTLGGRIVSIEGRFNF